MARPPEPADGRTETWGEVLAAGGRVARLVHIIAYCLVLVGVSAGSVLFLTSEHVSGVFESLANKALTFCTFGGLVIAFEAVYFWRYGIKARAVFDGIEQDSKGAAILIGLLTLGLCILAGAISGTL